MVPIDRGYLDAPAPAAAKKPVGISKDDKPIGEVLDQIVDGSAASLDRAMAKAAAMTAASGSAMDDMD